MEPAVALNLGVEVHAELEVVPVGVVHVAALSFDDGLVRAIDEDGQAAIILRRPANDAAERMPLAA